MPSPIVLGKQIYLHQFSDLISPNDRVAQLYPRHLVVICSPLTNHVKYSHPVTTPGNTTMPDNFRNFLKKIVETKFSHDLRE